MTEQEAQAFAQRLTRIWTRGRPLRREMKWLNFRHYSAWDVVAGQFQFFSHVSEEIHVFYAGPDEFNPSQPPQVKIVQVKGNEVVAALECHVTLASATCFDDSLSRGAGGALLSATKWLSIFRRGCWLSGCPIEATAHEKIEWMQAFTHEEIESWNLAL